MTLEMEKPTAEIQKSALDEKFAGVWESEYDKVYKFCLRRVQSVHDAEDMTNEVFLKAYSHFGSYEERGNPIGAWLIRIARNDIASYRRSPARREVNFSGEITTIRTSSMYNPGKTSDHYDGYDVAEDPIENLPDYIEVQRATEALKLVPEAQREVVIMRHVEERSVSDTAKALGKKENNVKQLQHKGTNSLRRIFTVLNSPPEKPQELAK